MIAACPFPCERGTPVRIYRMAEALAKRGHQVHVVTYHLGKLTSAPENLHIHRIKNIPTYRKMDPGPTPQKLLILDTLLIRRLRQLLREQPFDVIHAHHVEGLLTALSARSVQPETPIVFDVHTLLESELPFYGIGPIRSMLQKIGYWIDQTVSRQADFTITVTEIIRTRLLELNVTTPQTSLTIPNGVEMDLFQDSRLRCRDRQDDCTVIFTGNLASYQGIEPLLQAFALLHHRRKNVRLRIVTHTSFLPYERLAQELNIRHAIELIQDGFHAIPAWLAASDIAINPRFEAPGLPQKTMNYMAAGLPIVSYAGSGEHLINEKTALLVYRREPEALASALERLIDDPELAQRLGTAARHVVENQMNWEQTATMVENVYATVTSST